MSEEESREPNETRHSRNLQGVLRLAVENTGAHSNAPSNALSSLSQEEIVERRRFLDTVLNSLSVDVASVMKEAVTVLLTPETEDVDADDKVNAIGQLMEWVDNLDFATDFHKMGGFDALQPCLKSRHPEVRHKTAELIAELVQNHSYCQRAANETKLLETLLQHLDTDGDDTVRIKCLYAISALMRHNSAAHDNFLQYDGFSVVLRALQSDVEKLKIKATFLLSALCAERSSFKDILCNMGFVEQFVSLIHKEHDDTQEHVMSALLSLVSDHPAAIQECQREEFNLKGTLNDKIKLLTGNDCYLEELEYCQKLMSTCFYNSEGDNQPQDR